MADEDEGPRTVHLDPSQLPGGARFRAPVIPDLEPDAHAAAPPQTADPRATEPLGPRPPVIRRPDPDRTAFYPSAPRPPGAPSATGSAQVGTARAADSGSPQSRPVWTFEPSWSAYPARPASEAASDGPPTPAAAPNRAASASGKPGKSGKPGNKRTLVILLIVVVVASLIGAGVAVVFGDRIVGLVNGLTG